MVSGYVLLRRRNALFVAGMLSHQLQQHVIDGKKAIIQNPAEIHKYGDTIFGSGSRGERQKL